jgi:cytochrome c5
MGHSHKGECSSICLPRRLSLYGAAIAEGKEVFDKLCATCHGPGGAGDSPVGVTLDPAPADFTRTSVMQDTTDGYLFWRI